MSDGTFWPSTVVHDPELEKKELVWVLALGVVCKVFCGLGAISTKGVKFDRSY